MRLRDWIDPRTADFLIPTIGLTMFAAPIVGLAIGACCVDSSGSRKHGAVTGFVIGLVISFICFIVNGPLVTEYWAG
ncbi:hypothetical protein GC197_03125 [bacterium]|nr:hypothetical protein [bacterium]